MPSSDAPLSSDTGTTCSSTDEHPAVVDKTMFTARTKVFIVTFISVVIAVIVILYVILNGLGVDDIPTPKACKQEGGCDIGIDKDDYPHKPCIDVAIVGGGFAGAYTAWLLRGYNLDITLFEMTDRIGGGLYTQLLHNTSDIYLELGRQQYFDFHRSNTTFELLSKIQLSAMRSQYQIPADAVHYNLRHQMFPYNQLFNTTLPYQLPRDLEYLRNDPVNFTRHIFSEWVSQMNMTFSNESSTTAPPMNDVIVDDTDIVNSAGTSMRSHRVEDILLSYGNHELFTYLKDAMDSPYLHGDTNAQLFQTLLDEGMLDPVQEENLFTPVQGMSTIAQEMAEQFSRPHIRHSITYNKELIQIAPDPDYGNVTELTFQSTETRDNVTVQIGDQTTTCVYSVILALPPASLREVMGRMGVRNRQHNLNHILDQLETFPQTILQFVYSEPWWRNETQPEMRRLITNSPVRELVDAGLYTTENDSVAILHVNLDVINYAAYWEHLSDGDACSVCIAGQYTASETLYQQVQTHLLHLTRGASQLHQPMFVYYHKLTNDKHGGGRYAWKAGFDWSTVMYDLMKPGSQRVFITGGEYSPPPYQQHPIEGSIYAVKELMKHYNTSITG